MKHLLFKILFCLVCLDSELIGAETKEKSKNYDIFPSFSGEDTRHGFLSHLNYAFRQNQIVAFKDYQIDQGNEISKSLFEAIENSAIYLVIFSPNYASSSWCLDELVKILQCRNKDRKILIPLFYKVIPSTVRHQRGTYANAFVEHEKKYDKFRVKQWRSALNESSNISGFDSSVIGDESMLIEKIVQRVLRELDDIHKNKQFTKRELIIGLDNQIFDVESLLLDDTKDVRAIGIWGMPGIGKTTIAKEVFDRLCCYDSSEYERCYFMAGVREGWGRHGSMNLKKKLYSTLLSQKNLNIDTPYRLPPDVVKRLRSTKVLVVLDDVNDPQQLEILIGRLDWFGRGSRIIITTRDKQVYAKWVDDDHVYEVKPLDFKFSLQLFNLIIFEINHREVDFFENELSKKIVNYAQGIALVIKELGYFIGGKDKTTWESQFAKLIREPSLLKNVHDAVRLSYNDLNRVEKKVLLDIASLSDGLHLKVDEIRLPMNVENIQLLLKNGDVNLVDVLQSLKNKALLTISQQNGVSMHSIIQLTAREIVREESNEDQGKQIQLLEPNDKDSVSLKTVRFRSTADQMLTENRTRVSFWNYLKLDEPSLNAIGSNARINMMNFAFGNYGSQATYVYPGSSVPEWLDYKTTSDYMTIDLSDDDHLGFIFCFIVPKFESQGSILRFNIAIGEGGDDYIQVYTERTSHAIQSDHVYLMCNPVLSSYMNSRVKNQPKLEIRVTAESGTLTSEFVPLMLLKGFGISPINTSQYNHFSEKMKLKDGPNKDSTFFYYFVGTYCTISIAYWFSIYLRVNASDRILAILFLFGSFIPSIYVFSLFF